MEPISQSVYELLVRQGLRAMTAGTVEAHGIDAGLPGAQTDPLADAAAGGPRIRSGMGVKGTLAETSAEFTGGGQTRSGRNLGGSILRVYTNPNALKASTRKGAKTTLFLVVA